MHAKGELDVLAREVMRETAHLLQEVSAPDCERAARAEHDVETAPGEAVVQEGPQVLHVLKVAEQAVLQQCAAVVRAAAGLGSRCDCDVARDADHRLGIAHDEPHVLKKGVGQVERVTVHAAHVSVAGMVERRVEGIGLPAVFLGDHPDAMVARAAQDRSARGRARYVADRVSRRSSRRPR